MDSKLKYIFNIDKYSILEKNENERRIVHDFKRKSHSSMQSQATR